MKDLEQIRTALENSKDRFFSIFKNHHEMINGVSWESANKEINEAIKELSKFIESNGWQDIKSAPKDGTKVLLYIEGCVIEGEYDPEYKEWDCVSLPEHGCRCCSSANDIPTHWQPLPSIKSIKD